MTLGTSSRLLAGLALTLSAVAASATPIVQDFASSNLAAVRRPTAFSQSFVVDAALVGGQVGGHLHAFKATEPTEGIYVDITSAYLSNGTLRYDFTETTPWGMPTFQEVWDLAPVMLGAGSTWTLYVSGVMKDTKSAGLFSGALTQLKTVPEPGSLALRLGAAGLMGAVQRRRSSQR